VKAHKNKHTSIIQSDPLWIVFYNKLKTTKSTIWYQFICGIS